ncbi:MAG: CNNM domain-containing protein [Oceanipulchritudo sp.]
MTLLVAYFLLAIFVSFLCSLLEAVLLSLTPSYITAMRDSHARTGKLLEELKASVDRPLAAILSLNTIAHTVGAAGVGAQAQVLFQNIPLSVISGVLTLLILVFSEIIPKTFGAVYWRQLAVPSAYVLRVVMITMWPLVILSRFISRLIARDGEMNRVSRDEIDAMPDLGRKAGVLDPQDARLLESVINFGRVKVTEILTPRTVVKSLRSGMQIREALEMADTDNYSRYPVLQDPERLLGYVMRSDILVAAARDEWDRKIDDLLREMMILPDQATVKRAFGRFIRNREHMAGVVDEFGGFAGVVTLEDVLETLIGHEIMDEGDTVEDLREFARRASESEE